MKAEAPGGPRRFKKVSARLRRLTSLLELRRRAPRRLRALPRRGAQSLAPPHPRRLRPTPVPGPCDAEIPHLLGPVLVKDDEVVVLLGECPEVVVLGHERHELGRRPVVRQPRGVPVLALKERVEQQRAPAAPLRRFVHVKVEDAAGFHLLHPAARLGDEEPLGPNLEDADEDGRAAARARGVGAREVQTLILEQPVLWQVRVDGEGGVGERGCSSSDCTGAGCPFSSAVPTDVPWT